MSEGSLNVEGFWEEDTPIQYDTLLVHATSGDLSSALQRLNVFTSLMEDLEFFYHEDTLTFYDEEEGQYGMYCRIPHADVERIDYYLKAAFELNLITDPGKVLPGDLITERKNEQEVP